MFALLRWFRVLWLLGVDWDQTTGRFLAVKVEDLFDQLTEHYTRAPAGTHLPAGYDPDGVKAVFGA